MNKKFFLCIVALALCLAACDNIDDTTLDGKVKKAFREWSKDSLKNKHRIQSISYDTAGCPMDYMYTSVMLLESVGSSGHAESESNIGNGLIMMDCVMDTSRLTTNILIAKVQTESRDSSYTFYIGIRGDSICTTPQYHGYEALTKTHSEGEQYVYDACSEILGNLRIFAGIPNRSTSISDPESKYNSWIKLSSLKKKHNL